MKFLKCLLGKECQNVAGVIADVSLIRAYIQQVSRDLALNDNGPQSLAPYYRKHVIRRHLNERKKLSRPQTG